MRVAVVGGGANCEHEVSLASAAGVCEALASRHEVVELTIGRDGVWFSRGEPRGSTPRESLARALELLAAVDVVVPVLHGPHGEDGTLAALCDLAQVPCVGSPLAAGALAMDKWATKLVAEAVGVRTARGILVDRARPLTGPPSLEGPLVVKPVAAGSSYGVTLVRDPSELADALELALAYDDRALVEELVTGREIDLAVWQRPDGIVVAPPLEIVAGEIAAA